MTDSNLAKQILNAEGFRECYEMRTFWRGRVDPAQSTKLFSWDTLNHLLSGSPMKGATMLATLENLGVVASFSRRV